MPPQPITFSIEYLDTLRALPEIQTYKQVSYEQLAIKRGHKILEVGCATGEDVRTLAAKVGAKGRVVGVDISEAMLEEAQNRTQEASLPIEFHQGSAEVLTFDDCSFHGCRAERLLHLLNDPLQALKEMARVVRPGGRVVVGEPDWATLVLYPAGPSTDISIFEFDDSATMGRRLTSLFQQAGLQILKIVPVTCVITDFVLANQAFHLKSQILMAVEREKISNSLALEWLIELAESTQKGEFFSALTGFIVCGQKPSE
ncbi:MAG: methyltransferase domain-containing protein [Cyanobacteria bacterium P01_A01_bin.123]